MAKKKIKQCLNQLNMMAFLDQTPLDPDIITPKDTARFNDFLNRWNDSRFFGLDIETANVDSFGDGLNHFKGKIRLIQVSLPQSDEVLIVDMFGTVPVAFLTILKKTCESKTQHQVGAFIQFDLVWLQHQLNIHSNCPYDIRILSVLLWCGIKWDSKGKRMGHSLKDIYARLFDKQLDKESQLSDWSQPELSATQLNYAAMDVKVLLPCFLELSKRLKAFNNMKDLTGKTCSNTLTQIAQNECFAIPVFVEIILTGQPIDLELAKDVRKQYVNAIQEIYKPVKEILNLPFSASGAKLCSAIWEKLDILLVEEIKNFEEDEKNDVVEFTQLTLIGKEMPVLEPGTKLSTGSANLFYYYTQSKNECLIRLSLCRSLKKSLDSLDALVASALSQDGYAKGRYTSLGSTGSGRSTCAGDKKSSLTQTNLQNIAGVTEHPIVDAFNLPPVRSIISNKSEKSMWIVDLSALM